LVDDSRLRFREIAHLVGHLIITSYLLPFEADEKYLTVWFEFHTWGFGSVLKDISGFGNHAFFIGSNAPGGTQGPDKGLGSTSLAMELDGTQGMDVPDDTGIQLKGTTTGISISALINPYSFTATPTGSARYIYSKKDDDSNYTAIHIDSIGIIRFWIWFAGVDYSKKTTTAPVELNDWSSLVCTFNSSTHAAVIYVNGTSQTLTTDTITDPTITTADSGSGRVDGHVFWGSSDGYFIGAVSDFRYYREKILSSTDVTHLNTNKLSITNIPLGGVAIINHTAFS